LRLRNRPLPCVNHHQRHLDECGDAVNPVPMLYSAVAAALAVTCVACSSPPPRAERYVPPPLGSSWSYQVTSSGSFGSGVSPLTMRMARGEWQGQPVLRYEYATGATLQTDRIGLIAQLDSRGNPLLRYDPPLSYEWPLEIGRTWTQQHMVRVGAAGAPMPMTSRWRVEALEDVTVPAGTFKAWKIVMEDNLGFRQTTWSVPETMGAFARRINERAASHPMGGAGVQVFEMTSTPAVR
jgi:hypothetical protein